MTTLASARREEELVREHERLVGYMVSRFMRRCPGTAVERDDLMSWGFVGLIKAARAWCPDRGVAFSTLACRIIERSLLRGLQNEAPPAEAPATLSLDAPTDDGEGASLAEFVAAEEVGDREIGLTVRDALGRLSERDRALILRRYFEGWSLKEVGQEIGLSSMGVLARERHILRRLRGELAGVLGDGR
jgi:RNA polymerase sigma factor (sigma-70 family)